MNFQNFYTLIFKKNINGKYYIKILFSILTISLFLSFVLNRLDLTINGNDVLRHYQLDKIKDDSFQNISTIVVGDSSAGNAFDAKYFNTLNEFNTANLALSGNWGVIGSLGIVQESLKFNTSIKNVILIHTLDIWDRDFASKSLLELGMIDESLQNLDIKQIFAYLVNPKELWWHIKFFFKKLQGFNVYYKLDYGNDYIEQKVKKYSNDRLNQPNKRMFINKSISSAKEKELLILDSFCGKNNINCILLNGPIHSDVLSKSEVYMSKIKKTMNNFKNIHYIDKVFLYPSFMIGDAIDHVDIKYKKYVTEEYAKVLLEQMLILK